MSERKWRIDCIVGARPNFVKIAPILRAFHKQEETTSRLIHTGQHYDVAMNQVFFRELEIPDPEVNLEVGSGTNTEQTAKIMLGLEPILLAQKPDMLLVVGDVNSTLAASLVAAKLQIPLTHVEAGLRSNDRAMPEEINRIVTDRLADLLLTTEQAAGKQLQREGVLPSQIHFVGNVMIDTLYACLARARPVVETFQTYGAEASFVEAASNSFGFVTLHRPSNVDNLRQLRALLEVLVDLSAKLPLVFAMHPRTRARLEQNNLVQLVNSGRILVTPPLSYLQTIGLLRQARLCITDSGGIQEETTALGIPCFTVRDNTERPITVLEGTNTLVGSDPSNLQTAVLGELVGACKTGRIPDLWDGQASERIAQHVIDYLRQGRS